MIVQTQVPCQQKDSCSGEVGKPQSEHMKGVVTAGLARQPNQGGNVSIPDDDDKDE